MIIDNTSLFQQFNKERLSLSNLSKEDMIFQPFWNDFKLRFCWSSNSLEGNTLDLDETVNLILYDEVKSGHTYQEYTDAKRLYKAIEQYLSILPIKITEVWIQQCNSIIMNTERGYRTKNVYIGTLTEATFYPPDYHNLTKAMNDYMKNICNSSKDCEDVISYIAQKHIEFERIHPFQDGNGRTGRMILNQQLINQDMLPIAIDKTAKYRQAFRQYNKNGDISLMVHLIISNELDAIHRVQNLQEKYRLCTQQGINHKTPTPKR